MIKHFFKKTIACFVLLCVICCSLCISATAVEETGTINVIVAPFARGVVMTAYEVGYCEEGKYFLNSDFEESGVLLENLDNAEISSNVSQMLSEYAVEKSYTGIETVVDNDGTARFENLSADEKIYVISQKNGKGIMKMNPLIIVLPYYNQEGKQTVVDINAKFVNNSESENREGDVLLNKVDTKNNFLEGAVFKFERKAYYIEGYFEVPSGVEKGTDNLGTYYWQTLAEELTTNTQGQIVINNVVFGTYRFIEVKAPDGFIINSTPIVFDVEDKGTIKSDGSVYIKGDGEPVILTFVNEEKVDITEPVTQPTSPAPTNPSTEKPTELSTKSSGNTVFTMDNLTGSVVIVLGIAVISLSVVLVLIRRKRED